MARKIDDAPRMPDDYVMRALPKQMVDAMHNDEAEKWLEELADTSAAGDPDGTLPRHPEQLTPAVSARLNRQGRSNEPRA